MFVKATIELETDRNIIPINKSSIDFNNWHYIQPQWFDITFENGHRYCFGFGTMETIDYGTNPKRISFRLRNIDTPYHCDILKLLTDLCNDGIMYEITSLNDIDIITSDEAGSPEINITKVIRLVFDFHNDDGTVVYRIAALNKNLRG